MRVNDADPARRSRRHLTAVDSPDEGDTGNPAEVAGRFPCVSAAFGQSAALNRYRCKRSGPDLYSGRLPVVAP